MVCNRGNLEPYGKHGTLNAETERIPERQRTACHAPALEGNGCTEEEQK